VGAAGIVFGALGVGLATPPLVYVGIAMVAAVLVAGAWMLMSISTFLRRFPYARREVMPRPLTVGVPGRVTVKIQSTGHQTSRFRRTLTSSLDIREQAASELTGGMGTKATVSRTPESLTLTYSLLPSRRGRWPLGPALVHTSDPMGMIWSDTAVGDAERVPVWPSVVDLSATAGALMGHADRVVLGARSPSPDDAALRDYREGDDLRRVHWPSSARLGTMLVRSDERAGRRPATVLLDLSREAEALEWGISAAASIALSVLDSGHPVRLLGGKLHPDLSRHYGEHAAETARAAVLNQTVDLASPVSQAVATNDLIRAARQASDDAPQGEVIVGVFEPLEQAALDALAPIGDSGRAWAIVRTGDNSTQAQSATATAKALRRAGWRATTATVRSDLPTVWSTLLTAGDME
jgi:uncharacterized protein (DUF58 family)